MRCWKCPIRSIDKNVVPALELVWGQCRRAGGHGMRAKGWEESENK